MSEFNKEKVLERIDFLNGKLAELDRDEQSPEPMTPERRERIATDRQRHNAELEQMKSQLAEIEAAEQAQIEQEAARKLVIQEATDRAAYILDNLVVEGMTMRELCAGENEYQLLRIAVQSEFIAQAESASADKQLLELQNREALRAAEDRELQLKRQNDELQAAIKNIKEHNSEIVSRNASLENKFYELNMAVEDAESKRDAAMAKVDGLELLVSEKQAQIDILRNEAAVGAKAAPHIVDVEAQKQQMKSLAEQIKASRIKVYDVKPDDEINPRNYTAKRVDTDEEVTYNWTQAKNYIEIKDANEVSQFRAEYLEKNSLPDIPLATTVEIVAPVLPPFVTDEQFRGSVAGVQESETVSQENAGDGNLSGDAEGVAPTVSRQEFEELKAFVGKLELNVDGSVTWNRAKGQEVA